MQPEFLTLPCHLKMDVTVMWTYPERPGKARKNKQEVFICKLLFVLWLLLWLQIKTTVSKILAQGICIEKA
jgi:hypothetical protein